MGYVVGEVISIDDNFGAGRIKVRLRDTDKNKYDNDLPWAFPLLPKIINIIPKVGESVFVFFENDDPLKKRLYIGPIISQTQYLEYDDHKLNADKFIGGIGTTNPSIEDYSIANGVEPKKDETSLMGRKNSDIIIGDNDVRIRCGCKLFDNENKNKVIFNRTNPALIKLNYFENGLSVSKPRWNKFNNTIEKSTNKNISSCASIIGQEINLISTEGNPYANVCNPDGSITDEELKKFIENAHPLPYGDNLANFLSILINAFKNHTHNYNNLPPVIEGNMTKLLSYNMGDFLSKNIRIN